MQQLPDPVRVLHVTDPHLFADEDARLRGTVTHSTLQAVLGQIMRDNWPADLVAVTGDLTQDETAASYERFRTLLASLGLPVYCVPGNHDVRTLMQQELSEAPFYYCDTVRLSNWLIVGIDSCISGEAGGQIAPPELGRLDKLLSSTSAEHVLICLHHPPLPVGSAWLDRVGLQNGREFLELILMTGKTRAAIFGHIHQDFDATFDDIRIIGTPSTCRQFKTSSVRFALDDNPPAYRRITLQANGTVNAELMWLHNA